MNTTQMALSPGMIRPPVRPGVEPCLPTAGADSPVWNPKQLGPEILRLHHLQALAKAALWLILFPSLLLLNSVAQEATPVALSPPTIIERGPHHAVWQEVTPYVTSSGETRYRTNSYTELATGMNYQAPNGNGDWLESKEEVAIIDGLGVARQGQHQVIFAATATAVPVIDHSLPDSKRLQSRVAALAYFDGASGQSAWIAQIKEAVGQVQAAAVVVYPDSFSEVRADIRYTYKRHAFEQDIILREQLPDPASLNPPLDPSTVLLQVWTEFFNPPAPQKNEVAVYQEADALKRQRMAVPDLVDEFLNFTSMEMRKGIAFTIGDDDGKDPMDADGTVRVCKTWLDDPASGRHFLVESVPYAWLAPMLRTLPPRQAALGQPKAGAQWAKVHLGRKQLMASLPKAARLEKKNQSLQLAKADTGVHRRGVVVDYSTISANQTNYRFQSDLTYYITAPVVLSGTSPGTTFEAGTVIKFSPTNSPKLTLTSPIVWEGTPYLPVVLTAKDDKSIGENITGAGTLNGVYADIALDIDANTSGTNAVLQNVRVSHAKTAIAISGKSGHVISHAQFVNCNTGIKPANAIFSLRNALFYNVQTNFNASTATGHCEHLTSDTANWMNLNSAMTLNLTNSLLVGVTNYGTYTADSVSTASSGAAVFKTVGAGYHYLLDDTYRNTGTININSDLAADLKKTSTYPPLVLTNDFTANTTLAPQAGRDTDIPDRGFHYWPLDYCWSGLKLTNSTLLLTNGVAIGLYGDSGTVMKSGGKFVSEGSPTVMNRLVRYNAVQENTNIWGGSSSFYMLEVNGSSSVTPEMWLRFTDVAAPNAETSKRMLASLGGNTSKLALVDCFLRGLCQDIWNYTPANNPSLRLTNNLIQRTFLNLTGGYSSTFYPTTLYLRNNLFWRGSITFNCYGTGSDWEIKDNFFDTVTLSWTQQYTATNSNNGYFSTTAIPGGSNNRTLTTNDYQSGPLGKFYYPTNGASGGLTNLVNYGSRTADLASLYHFVTQVSLTRETNSTVDIGFHYVATDANGNSIDSDGDGIADYIEDRNNNGTVNSGETDWNNAGDLGLKVWITKPKNNSNIP